MSLIIHLLISFFDYMINEKETLYYITSIEMVLKELRKEKNISQANVNLEFEEKYGFAVNFGRIESYPNFRMETFFYICDYFNISIEEFSKRILNKKKQDITRFLAEKEKRRKNSKK